MRAIPRDYEQSSHVHRDSSQPGDHERLNRSKVAVPSSHERLSTQEVIYLVLISRVILSFTMKYDLVAVHSDIVRGQ